MTREDAIECLSERVSIGKTCEQSCMVGFGVNIDTLDEALDVAISALRQQDVADKDVGKNEPLTNAQKIRAMSDEEIAEYVCRNSINTLCDIICGGECNAIATLKKSGDWACKEIVMKWLQQPAEEDDHD